MDASQDRREFKFLLPKEKLEEVRARVADNLEVDRDSEDGYQIRSDYFDSDDRASYWQKVLGHQNRRRVRTRTYGDANSGRPPTRFIEIKHKQQGVTVKRRMLATEEEMNTFTQGTIPPLQGEHADRFISEMRSIIESPPWKPVVRIQYHRWAYDSGTDGTIRITFDTKIRCCFPDYGAGEDPEPHLDLLSPGDAIMEVKTIGSVPYWFRSLVGDFSLVPRGFSKYTVALEHHEFGRPNIHEHRRTA